MTMTEGVIVNAMQGGGKYQVHEGEHTGNGCCGQAERA